MKRLINHARKLIKEGFNFQEIASKEEMINHVVNKICEEEPLTNQELEEVREIVIEMINNYY